MSTKILLFYLFLHPIFCLEKFLIFTSNENVVERKSVYELDQREVNIDAYLSGQVLVKYIQYMTDFNFQNLKFYCQVKALEQKNKISTAFLCKKDSLSTKEDCHPVNKESQIIKFVDVMTFNIEFDPTKGFTATLDMDISVVKKREKSFDGFYYCKLRNQFGALQSNFIEIQDFEYYKKKVSSSLTPMSKNYEPTAINTIKTDSFPIFLDCGKSVGEIKQDFPTWVSANIISPFVWNLCPGATNGIACYTVLVDSRNKNARSLSDVLDYYQYSNGTIALLGVKGSNYQKSGMICSYTSFPLKSYAIYLTKSGSNWEPITFDQSNKYDKRIEPLSPLFNNIEIREGSYETYKFKLRASYVATSDHTKKSFLWLKNDYYHVDQFEANAFELIFPKDINKEHAGKYTLNITQTDIGQSVKFVFNVKVVGVPILKKNPLQVNRLNRMVDQSVNLSVVYENDVNNKALEVNGVNIDFSSEDAKTLSLNSLFFQFAFLTGINISCDFGDSLNPGFINYKASNLYRKEDMPLSKTHTVTFVGKNDIGYSRTSFLIRVFEHPTFINILNYFNCTNNCQSNKPHTFKCSINESEFIGEGLQVKYLWNLNKQNLNNMNEEYIQKSYMKITGDTVELKPITGENSDDEKMAAMLKDATLSCQVTIYEPLLPTHNPPPPQLLYNSDNYPDLKQKLKAKINLDLNVLAKGSPPWILPLIISLIVLVVLIILILYFCLRGSGESYNVDQKERAQGYDPEKEIRDNETFQPYERDHDNNIMEPSRLSFNDEDSVGVGSDDGELDVYDIDPGKFNEEGSFIGQYASDPRKHKVANT